MGMMGPMGFGKGMMGPMGMMMGPMGFMPSANSSCVSPSFSLIP